MRHISAIKGNKLCSNTNLKNMLSEKKPGLKECVLCDFIYVKYTSRQNSCMVIAIRTVLTL